MNPARAGYGGGGRDVRPRLGRQVARHRGAFPGRSGSGATAVERAGLFHADQRLRSTGDAGIVEMALPLGASAMRDHRSLFVVTLVSALSLQSSGEEGGDGALRWTGLTRAELYSGRDVLANP